MIAVSIPVLLVLGACFLLVFRFASGQVSKLPATTGWLQALSVERYRPMLRLLTEEDLRFLRSQLGFTRSMETRLRINRSQMARGYLRAMQADFALICTALKTLMAQSQQDRPDLASTLIRSQLMFAFGCFLVETRILLFRHGLGSVGDASVFSLFDGLRLELLALLPAANTV